MKQLFISLVVGFLFIACNQPPSPPCPNNLSGNYRVTTTVQSYEGDYHNNILKLTNNYDTKKEMLPIDDTLYMAAYSNLIGLDWYYIFQLHNNNCSLTATANETMRSQISGDTFEVFNITLDPGKKTIHVVSKYTNTSGNDRIIDELFTPE